MDYMRETWRSLANDSPRDYDVVAFEVQPWNASHHDWGIDPPPLHADWNQWPEHAKPPLLVDSLCMARGRDVSGFQPYNPVDNNLGSALTADHIAAETMDAVKTEIERQTGTWPEPADCCIVLFMEIFYAVGYGYIHINDFEHHVGAMDVLEFEGHMEMSFRVGEDALIDEGTDPFDFYVKESAKLIHVEATWDDPRFSLELRLRGPGGAGDEWPFKVSGGTLGDPQSPVALTVWRENVTTWNGDWLVTMTADDLARDVDYRIVVTIFNWAPIFPEGYTAL